MNHQTIIECRERVLEAMAKRDEAYARWLTSDTGSFRESMADADDELADAHNDYFAAAERKEGRDPYPARKGRAA